MRTVAVLSREDWRGNRTFSPRPRPRREGSQNEWRWAQSATNRSPRQFLANRETRLTGGGDDVESPESPAFSRIVAPQQSRSEQGISQAGTGKSGPEQGIFARLSHASITTIDEIERGLEPYRLRKLLSILEETAGQVFLTTHGAVAISCGSEKGNLWYLDGTGAIGSLPADQMGAHQKRDPETFLAKLAVVGDGETEVGLLRYRRHAPA